RVRDFAQEGRVNPAALLHPPEAEDAGARRTLHRVLRYRTPQLCRVLHPVGTWLQSVGVERRVNGVSGHISQPTPILTRPSPGEVPAAHLVRRLAQARTHRADFS